MMFKVAFLGMAAVVAVAPVFVFADESAPAAAGIELPQTDPEMESEIGYVEALVNGGYPDFAAPVVEAVKKRWPDSEARLFAIEVRGLLSMGRFDEAEKKIATLPDRKSTKFLAARLEVANSYFQRGRSEEGLKIYNEFFSAYPKPPKDIFAFYLDACYSYGQLLARDGKVSAAAESYGRALAMLQKGSEKWCELAVETAELWIRVADNAQGGERSQAVGKADELVKTLLWQQRLPVIFGRAVSMRAHLELLRGRPESAAETIDDFLDDLRNIHTQIESVDPENRFGLLRQSPLPECRYLQAKMRFDEAQRQYKDPKRDDERIKALLFGPKTPSGKRDGMKGAYGAAFNIFLNYESSAWAPDAGELAEEVKAFAEKHYNAKIKTHISKEQLEKARRAQFKVPASLMAEGESLKAIKAYEPVLAKFPEVPEAVVAVESIASAWLDLAVEAQAEALKEEYRLNAEAVEGYLLERFCDWPDDAIMLAAGDGVLRLAAKEAQFKNLARADRLYSDFITSYRRHAMAPNIAAGRAAEFQRSERWEDAVKYWKLAAETFPGTPAAVTALAQLSFCCGKLGDKAGEIEYINRYLEVEQVKVRRLQAQFQLANMYKNDGLGLLGAAATNATPEEAEAEEKRGTAQMIRAIKTFSGFAAEAEAALNDPTTSRDDLPKYRELKEAAAFMVGECWSRMTRPESNLASYRERAAKSFEEYVSAYPEGKWAKLGYVKLGTIYTAMGDLPKSKDALDRLSRKFPDSDEAKNAKPRLARSLMEMGLKKEGTEIYGEMLHTDGAYTALQLLNAGEALVDARSWDLANQAFTKAIRLAGTNENQKATQARARLGLAKCAWKQGSLVEAREAIDMFLSDPKMSRMTIAADANFMLVEVASAQGRAEKDDTLRGRHFGAAVGALNKVRQYWAKRPDWERKRLELMSGDVMVDRMKAEEAMGLKDEARESCERAAAKFQVFMQSNGVTDAHPLDKMEPGEIANLERAYASAVPLFSRLGAEQADRVIRYGEEYLALFPNGKDRAEIGNCINRARADLPSGAAVPAPAPESAAAPAASAE